MKLPSPFPKWYKDEEYCDLFYDSAILIRQNWDGRVLLAPKGYKFANPLFKAYFGIIDASWRLLHKTIRYCAKRGWLKPEPGDRICWESLKIWYRNARV